MLQKKLTLTYSNKIFIISLGFLSFYINYHYGFIGIMPMDNTVLFNGGYRVLEGYRPFTDYWLVTGPLLDYLNAFFFKLLGVSWSTFIIHSSIINSLFAIISYFLFKKIGLSNLFSFIYSLLISILFYPIVGTPFVDHHSVFFMIAAFYTLIFFIKTKNFNYFIFIPPILLFSFLSKQTPAAYGIIIISFFILLLSSIYKDKKKVILMNSTIGSVMALVLLFLFFFVTEINFYDFLQQYIFFGSSIGGDRLANYKFSLINVIIKYKFISIFVFILLFVLIKLKIKNFLTKDDFLILSIFICLSILLIFHQMITLNQNFIFFLIPLLCGIAHSFYKKTFETNYLLTILIIICLFSTFKYHVRFNEERKFNELENIDVSKSIDAKIIDVKLKGLKWISHLNPNNPREEVNDIIEILKYLKNDKNNKILITEYQIISPILDVYDNSPNQWHHPSVSFPTKGDKYFENYKSYFISKIKEKEVNYIFETRKDDKFITGYILDADCFSNERIGNILVKLKLNLSCKDLK